MRHAKALSFALAASCLPSCGPHRSAEEPRPAAVVTVALEGGACIYRWNGAPISREALLQNSATLLIHAAGRIEELENEMKARGEPAPEAPPEDSPGPADFRLEAVPSLPFSCFGPALRIAQRVGFSQGVLRIVGERLPDQRVFFDFDLPGAAHPPYVAVVGIEAAGRMTWNGEPVDPNGLRARVRATGGQRADAVAVAPSDGVKFITFYETLQLIGQVMAMPTLSGCAAESGPPGSTRPCRVAVPGTG